MISWIKNFTMNFYIEALLNNGQVGFRASKEDIERLDNSRRLV